MGNLALNSKNIHCFDKQPLNLTGDNMLKKSILLSTSVALALSMAAPSYAQDADDEIIVTATKRQQTLQEVPIAVTVTTGATIEKAQILDIIDLQSVVPSLRVSQLQNSVQTNFIIRGFGNGANNAGIEPSVGVFIDGVYRSRSAAQIGDLPKLERVEVLRGPQSTLFGKNASAGVISVVTAKPSFTFNGYAEGGLSNYDGRQGKAYFTGPLSDDVAISIGGNFNKRDGYAENVTLGTDLNDRDRFGLRGQILVQPADNMEFRVIADYDELNEICCYAPNLINGPTGATVPLLGGQVITDPFGYRTALTFDPTNKVQNHGISFHADIGLNDKFDLTSITSFRDSYNENNGDVDFHSAPSIENNPKSLDIQTFTQEVRLASNFDGPLNGIVGGYFFSEKLEQTDGIFFGSAWRPYVGLLLGDPTLPATLEALSGVAPGTFFQQGTGVSELSTQSNTTFNAFGQFDYEITDRLTATAGLAFVKDKKNISISQNNTDVFSNTDLFTVNGGAIPNAFFGAGIQGVLAGNAALAGLCGGQPSFAAIVACVEGAAPGTSAAIQAGVNANITAISGLQFLPQLIGIPNAIEDGKSNDENVDYSFRLAYDVTDSINVYGSYGTGYKATSWNLSRDSRPTPATIAQLFPGGAPFNLVPSTRFAEPEEATTIELGVKAKFDLGSLNVAIFDQNIKNFQSNVFTGAAFSLANAEKQSVRGVEWEALLRPVEGLTLGSAGTYLDPNYDRYTASAFGDISGTRPGGIPEFSLSTSIGYNFNVGGNDAFVRADHQFESSVDIQDGGNANPANVTLATVDARERKISLINASAGVTIGAVDLSIWGRNLFNNEYLITNFPTVAQSGSFNGYANQPRTYGIKARYSFD